MIEYLANQIILGALSYSYVTERRPDLKQGIDDYLTLYNRQDLMV
ncbi:hypothetical protein [Terribacillus saccharophilus]